MGRCGIKSYQVFGLCPLSGIPKHIILEFGPVSLSGEKKIPTPLDPSE
jgi:hypothetical protein